MSVRKRKWTTTAGVARESWAVDYVDGAGRRRHKSFSKKKDADTFAAKTSVEVGQGTHVADGQTITVKVAGAYWMKAGEKEGLERTNPQLMGETGGAPAAKGSKNVADLPKIPEAYVELATSSDGSEIAGVSSSRTELGRWRGASETAVAPLGTALTNPMYASDGRLWIAGLASGGPRIWTFDGATLSGNPHEVTAPWLDGRQVVNLSVSPDATRLAVLSKLPSDTDYRLAR